jgi:UPF0271 protein
VSRKEPGAVLHDAAAVATRAVTMATTGEVLDADGGKLTMRADSLCVHGDTPGAVELARRIRESLEAAGVTLAPFA